MSRHLKCTILLIIPLLTSTTPRSFSSRSPKIEDTQPTEDPNLPHKRLISSINKFSNRLYNVMHEYKSENDYSSESQSTSEDLIYSPLCIFQSLATLQSGSTKETKTELSTILSTTKINDTVIKEGLNSILQTYTPTDEEPKVNLLNRVFLDHCFTPTEKYVNQIRDKFHGEVVQTHFSNATAASMFVNKHIYVASHGILQDVISVEPPPESATEQSNGTSQYTAQAIDGGLMLISGLTFEGDFDRPFTPILTRKEHFTREDGSKSEVEMMHRDGVYLHAEIPELNASALNIVYKNYRYSLTILLPEEETTIAQLEENLESFPFIAVLSRLKKQYMQVSLPRFQVETTIDLIDPLEKMGIRRIFSEQGAQLGKLVNDIDDGELYLTNAVHKVVLDVREGGSRVRSQNFIEAVPAQARVLTPFTVNKPFVFFIADQLLNAVLIAGRKAL